MESTELGRRVCGFRSSQAGLLFIKCLYRRRYIILAMAAALPVMLFIFGTLKFVMSDADLLMFFNITEAVYPFFCSMAICTMLKNKDEAELYTLTGRKVSQIAAYGFIIYFSAVCITGFAFGLILLPPWIKPLFALSFPITLLFTTSLAFFVRFLTDNIYVSIAVYAVLFLLLYMNSGIYGEVTVTAASVRFDAFISGYFHIPQFSNESGYWFVPYESLFQNRAIFACCAAVIWALGLALTYRNRLQKIKR